ncbi:hypothetical protein HOY80DRAFT_921306 [Tuber brumale]|nr:hypothetical protein HOY80DRAFT_921306 [Tuber brumale]
MTTPPTQYLSALSLASSPPQSSGKQTPSYRSLLKSHRRLESTITALQSQLNEEKRSAAWWKNRVCELDARCRSIDVDLARVTKEKHALDRTVAMFQMRERLVPRMIEAETQTDEEGEGENAGESQKDLVIKALAQMVWNKQVESVLLPTGAPAGCECDAAKALRNLFPKPPSKARDMGPLEGRESGRAPLAETPPHPHPEAASKPRREKRAALKMRIWAERERVDRLQKENEVLEGLLRGGPEANSNRAAERYGDGFGYD